MEYSQFGDCNNTQTTANGSSSVPFSPLPSLERYGWGMAAIGLVIWLDAYIFVTCFNTAATRQILRIRTEYLKVTSPRGGGYSGSEQNT